MARTVAGCWSLTRSTLIEVVAHTERGERIQSRLNQDTSYAAPHVIDAEVLGTIRRRFLFGFLDQTAASLAVEELRDWPGERFGHRALLERAWQLRDNVRTWDAMYVALAEALQAPLLTTDERLSRVRRLACTVEIAPD